MPEHIVCFCPGYTMVFLMLSLILALICLIERTAMVMGPHGMHTLNCLITAALCSLCVLVQG